MHIKYIRLSQGHTRSIIKSILVVHSGNSVHSDKRTHLTIESINSVFVRTYVTLNRISWIIFTSDLVTSDTDKLLVFRWVHIVLPL